MAGFGQVLYWDFIDREEAEVYENAKKKNEANTAQAWSTINDLLHGQKENLFFAGPTREIPSRQNRPILPAHVANQNAGFASSCLLTDSAIYN